MSITEDQARLIAKDEIEQAQEKCPLRSVIDRLENAANRMGDEAKTIQRENRLNNQEHAELLNRIATKVERHNEIFIRQAATNSRIDEDIRRATDEFRKNAEKSDAEDKVLHGRVTGIVWWLLGISVTSIGGLVGIIFIIIQLFAK
jgi:hypothetical protein